MKVTEKFDLQVKSHPFQPYYTFYLQRIHHLFGDKHTDFYSKAKAWHYTMFIMITPKAYTSPEGGSNLRFLTGGGITPLKP